MKKIVVEPTTKKTQQPTQSLDYSSYSSSSTVISYEEMQKVIHDLNNPPQGTPGLSEILREIDREYCT